MPTITSAFMSVCVCVKREKTCARNINMLAKIQILVHILSRLLLLIAPRRRPVGHRQDAFFF